jgi:hypothetical protein
MRCCCHSRQVLITHQMSSKHQYCVTLCLAISVSCCCSSSSSVIYCHAIAASFHYYTTQLALRTVHFSSANTCCVFYCNNIQLQEIELNRFNAKNKMESHLFMPTAADATVRAFRKWYAKSGGVKWAKGVTADETSNAVTAVNSGDSRREVLLDRYSAHTKNCASCRNALQATQKVCVCLCTLQYCIGRCPYACTINQRIQQYMCLCDAALDWYLYR